MSLILRQAHTGDEPDIVALIQILAAAEGDHIPLTEAYAAQYLLSAPGAILLAEQDRQVVGLLSYSLRPNLYHAGLVALIEELVVLPAMRGQGIGGRLLAEALQQIAALGCAEVSVTTMPGNAGAIRFYRRHGLVDEAVYLERHFRTSR